MILALFFFLFLLFLSFVIAFLMRKQKKQYLVLTLFLLYVLGIPSFIMAMNQLGTYTLKPGESVKIEVNSLTNQPDYSSELELDNLDGAKLQLSNKPNRYWIEYRKNSSQHIAYDTETQKITTYDVNSTKSEEKELKNTSKQDVYLRGRNLIIQAKGKKFLSVTGSKKYYLVIKNLSNKPAHFKATVTNR